MKYVMSYRFSRGVTIQGNLGTILVDCIIVVRSNCRVEILDMEIEESFKIVWNSKAQE
jgi:hypothetical protein